MCNMTCITPHFLGPTGGLKIQGPLIETQKTVCTTCKCVHVFIKEVLVHDVHRAARILSKLQL